MKLIIILAMIFQLNAQLIDYDIKPSTIKGSKYMNIEILDSKEVRFDDKNGIDFTEVSDLAYHDLKLYAVSDHGYLYHFNIDINDDKINDLVLKKAYRLKSKKGKKLKGNKTDSEGLFYDEGELFISFERKHRVGRFSLNGVKIKSLKIHKDLRDENNYKSSNKGLESVTYSKKYGLITAPEKPLKKEDKKYHKLYSKKQTWRFKASGKITALEFMDEDNIMILERNFDWLTRQRVTHISKINLKNCKVKLLAKLDSDDGWKLDNFEGLTKVDKNKYMMISDDNQMFYQKTLLVLFKVE